MFAAEPIMGGTVTSRFVMGFDQISTAAQIAALPEVARLTIETSTQVDQASGLYAYCVDNARVMNHGMTRMMRAWMSIVRSRALMPPFAKLPREKS